MDRRKVNDFLKAISDWAEAQPDIQALALVGSYARGSEQEGSDIDLIMIATNPMKYILEDCTWVNLFGIVEKFRPEDYGRVISLRVHYKGGLEVEFGITDESWAQSPLDPGTQQVISDGMRVLFERGDVLSRSIAAEQ